MKRLLLAAALLAFIALGVSNVVKHNNKLEFQKVELEDTALKLKKLEQDYNSELQQKNVNQDTIKQLEQQKQDLQSQLEARAAEKERLASLVTTPKVYAATAPSTAVVGNCGDNIFKQYIYQHESGCNTGRYNSIGCFGIGQSCPASKISYCGTDFACQDAWFTQYANNRYGGWAGAYAFWLAHRWW